MCPHSEQTRKKGSMGIDVFKKIVDNKWLDDSDFVRLHGMGEPLMNKNIFGLIEYASSKNINTEISTNICLLGKANADKLLGSDLKQIILSLDGITKNTYEHVRVKADFEKSLENLRNFLDLKKKRKSEIYTIVQIIFMQETVDEIVDFVNYWKAHGSLDEIRIRFYSSWAMQDDDINEQYNSFISKNDVSRKRKNPCRLLWESVVIQFDGKVVPCCRDFDSKYVLGDLNTNTLHEIWNGNKFRNLRKNHLSDKYDNPLCRHCTEYDEENPSIARLINKAMKRVLRINKNAVQSKENVMYSQLEDRLGAVLSDIKFELGPNELRIFLK